MDVVCEMTPGTFTDCGLQSGEILRADMAANAIEKRMFTNEREVRIAVVKRGAIRIQAIMTTQTGRVKVADMLNDKCSIIRGVTSTTCTGIEIS